MRVEQVMFAAVRRASEPYFPDGADGIAPEYLVRAGFVCWPSTGARSSPPPPPTSCPARPGAASGLLNSSRRIGGSLGLAALGTVTRNRTDQTAVPVALNDRYALGLTLSAALLVADVLITLTVLRRTRPPSRAEQANDRDLLPGIDR